jgi:hypothetical protein
MKRITTLLILTLLLPTLALAGLGSKKTKYVGGTISALPEGVEGVSSAKDEKEFVFEHKNGRFAIPFDRVTELEYGQKAGRRVAVAILLTPLALFSKKRKHYLTITYKDANDKEQVGVFEFGKDVVRVNLASLSARTGKEITYQDEDARKSAKGN